MLILQLDDVPHPYLASCRVKRTADDPLLRITVDRHVDLVPVALPEAIPSGVAIHLTATSAAVVDGAIEVQGDTAIIHKVPPDADHLSIEDWLEVVLLPEVTIALDAAEHPTMREPTSLVFRRLKERGNGSARRPLDDVKLRRREALGEALSRGRASIVTIDHLPDGELWRPRVSRGQRVTEVSLAHPFARAVADGLVVDAPGADLAAELLAALSAAEQDALDDATRDAYEMLRRRISRVLARARRGDAL